MSAENLDRVNSAPAKISDAIEEVRRASRDELLWIVAKYRELTKAHEQLSMRGLRVVQAFEAIGRAKDAAQLLIEKRNCEQALVALEAALKSTVELKEREYEHEPIR